MLQQKLHYILIKHAVNTIIGFIFFFYFFVSSSIVFLSYMGTKVICDRLEPGYVLCERDALRIDRLVKRKKTNFRLRDIVIKNNRVIYELKDIESKASYPKGTYSVYFKADDKLIFHASHEHINSAHKEATILTNYIYNRPNPESFQLNIRNQFLELYPQSKSVLIINSIVLSLGWIILIVIVRPIFRKINILQ